MGFQIDAIDNSMNNQMTLTKLQKYGLTLIYLLMKLKKKWGEINKATLAFEEQEQKELDNNPAFKEEG